MKSTTTFVLTAIASLALVAAACSGNQQPAATGTSPSAKAAHPSQGADSSQPDIVDIAASAGSFDTLVTAVKAAGLVDALKADGPLTVFAPTDEAFAKLPAGTLDSLLKDKEKLTAILTYHVVPGKVMASDVMGLTSANTLNGQSVPIDTSNGVRVGAANVVKTDIVARNGVIHVIDTVLLPQ